MPSANSVRIKIPDLFGGQTLAKAHTETGIFTAYRRIRREYPNEVIRLVFPGGGKQNIQPYSNLDLSMMDED